MATHEYTHEGDITVFGIDHNDDSAPVDHWELSDFEDLVTIDAI